MSDIEKITLLKNDIDAAMAKLSIDQKKVELTELVTKSETANFWNDNRAAGVVMQQINSLRATIEPWDKLSSEVKDLIELSEINDSGLVKEIDEQYDTLKSDYEKLKKHLRFDGQYDTSDAILSIHAGAGGTDAQDWAQMLVRMYGRWSESSGYKVTVLEESPGEEAGIKSIQLEISGQYAYGKLRGEHGVHRLVRLSPFNADAKRQTSFAKVEVLPKIDAPDAVPIDEADLKIDVFRSGGKGGQSVNTTDSAVRVTHLPTGIVISIQNERSQIQNKETAMTILRSKLAQLQMEQHLESLTEIKGPNQSAEWGNQIRSYVLHPYTMVKDLRTRYETVNAQHVLDGALDEFIDANLEQIPSQ